MFKETDYTSGGVFGQGISNCYLYTYRFTNDNPHQLTERDECSAFVSDTIEYNVHFDDCTSSMIWNEISCIQDIIWKALNRYAERQENWAKIICNNNPLLWQYLLNRTTGLVNQVQVPPFGIIRCSTTIGCDRQAYRVGTC
jgi:hypothetical protein